MNLLSRIFGKAGGKSEALTKEIGQASQPKNKNGPTTTSNVTYTQAIDSVNSTVIPHQSGNGLGGHSTSNLFVSDLTSGLTFDYEEDDIGQAFYELEMPGHEVNKGLSKSDIEKSLKNIKDSLNKAIKRVDEQLKNLKEYTFSPGDVAFHKELGAVIVRGIVYDRVKPDKNKKEFIPTIKGYVITGNFYGDRTTPPSELYPNEDIAKVLYTKK